MLQNMPEEPTRPEPDVWEPTQFSIGDPWPWEPEWVATRGFRWLPDSMMLLMVEDDVTQQMCDDIAGPADLALIGAGPLVGILARFGDNWGWAESMVWRRPGQGIPSPLQPDGTPTPHVAFHVVLVDNQTKLIRHMRLFTASAHFTKSLYREAADRWASGTTAEEADAAFAAFEARYPSINDTVRGSLARCHGGD
jgi:hypothetical protein